MAHLCCISYIYVIIGWWYHRLWLLYVMLVSSREYASGGVLKEWKNLMLEVPFNFIFRTSWYGLFFAAIFSTIFDRNNFCFGIFYNNVFNHIYLLNFVMHSTGDIPAISDNCSNHTVDKTHSAFHLMWKVECNQHFIYFVVNKIVLQGPKNLMRAVMINMVYLSSAIAH